MDGCSSTPYSTVHRRLPRQHLRKRPLPTRLGVDLASQAKTSLRIVGAAIDIILLVQSLWGIDDREDEVSRIDRGNGLSPNTLERGKSKALNHLSPLIGIRPGPQTDY